MTHAHAPKLELLFPRLLAAPTSRLPYQHNVLIRSFLLLRDTGNVIVYNSPGINQAAGDIRAHGGADQLLITHAHEAMYGTPAINASAAIHAGDAAGAREAMVIARTFGERHFIADYLEAIPTPGHTPGSTSYLWDSGDHRYLFTGDFLWIENGHWYAVLFDPQRRSQYIDSLELVRELDFDVLVPWGVTEGGPPYACTDHDDLNARISMVIERIATGGSR